MLLHLKLAFSYVFYLNNVWGFIRITIEIYRANVEGKVDLGGHISTRLRMALIKVRPKVSWIKLVCLKRPNERRVRKRYIRSVRHGGLLYQPLSVGVRRHNIFTGMILKCIFICKIFPSYFCCFKELMVFNKILMWRPLYQSFVALFLPKISRNDVSYDLYTLISDGWSLKYNTLWFRSQGLQ